MTNKNHTPQVNYSYKSKVILRCLFGALIFYAVVYWYTMFSEFVSFTPFGFVESDLFFIFVGFSLLAASPFIAFWLIEKHRTMRAQLIAAIILMPATLFWCFMTASLIAEGLSNITQSLTLLFHIVGPAFLSVSLVALLIMHWVRNRRVLNAADA